MKIANAALYSIFFLVATLALTGGAQAQVADGYYTLESITTEFQGEQPLNYYNLTLMDCNSSTLPGTLDPSAPPSPVDPTGGIGGPAPTNPGGGGGIDFPFPTGGDPVSTMIDHLDQIINIGLKIWGVIEKGKPVMNLKHDVGTALPVGARCWTDLESWSRPVARTYAVSIKNKLGAEVVKFKYQILAVTGGQVDGKGRYIGFATIVPVQTSVAWGYNFNAKGEVPVVMNMGTKADPVAGMQLSMNYTIETPVKTIQAAQNYFLDGQGHFEIVPEASGNLLKGPSPELSAVR